MNSLEIKKYLINNKLNQECIIINYDFIGASGNFVKNEIFKNNIQFSGDANNSYLNGIYNPGYFNKINSNIIPGSGKFNEDNFLKTSHPINLKEFTFLIKYQNDLNNSSYKDGLGEILLQIKNFNTPSEINFCIGLNDLRKVFIDFSGSNFLSTSLNNKIARNNVLAGNYVDNNLNIYHIDLFNNIIKENALTINDINFSTKNKQLLFGGTDNPNYTGFSGYINNILIFDKSLSKNDIYNISLLLEKTGEFIEQSFVNITGLYRESGYLNPTGVLNTGVIDYQIIQENVTLENINNNINTHINLYSGIIGPITGEKIEYQYVENVEKIFTGEKIINQYNSSEINLYSGINDNIQNVFESGNPLLFYNEFERFT